MTEEKRLEKIDYLRKQRDGIIEGGYRDLLVATYTFLKECCAKSTDFSCNPYNNTVCMAVYGNTYHVPMVSGFIRDLANLGYIKITGYGADRKITIAKELDF